ncbi:DNA-binding response regulator [Streptomyces antioxidans]|uniref:DNA-binding response regulator n=1 Tax=Streptomyces antioxidans TaxID=1507734 RepID=A0A1V4DE60_9ACTN|nr:response regulator transcription factor [Streptomyces antioxidans]OPF84762.1 DNA-binding response regulator [Streptomyces antioxidans]
MTISVLLADDQPLIRAGFSALLNSDPGIDVVGEAGDGDEAVSLASRLCPDVVLMDVQMPGTNGIEATRRIAADPELAGVRVVILTNYALDVYVFEALRAGACGFLVKDTEPAELLRSVRVAVDGQALLSPLITQKLIAEYVARPPTPVTAPALDVLTPREREVLTLVGSGRSNEEIAAQLVVSHTTAKTHVSRTMIKLGARDRAQLVVFAYETGLVTPRTQRPG